jgi:NDP-4-keto-2,6-dideoxyhexose 3-C-methyltransferase
MLKIITQCRICHNKNLTPIFSLGEQALTGVFPKRIDQKVTSGPVDLVKCDATTGCGLVQLSQSYDLSEMYGLNYGYRSGLNQSMVNHLHGKVKRILDLGCLQPGDVVIDIGSNDATTLKAYPKGMYQLIGVDPTGIKFKDYYPESIQLIPDFFSAKAVSSFLGDKRVKVITSFSMFYDLEDPVQFAREIAETIDENGIWVFEQSYLPTMLKTNSFDTICHEHLEFYSMRQINWILDAVDMRAIDVEFNDINGGSFSITAAKKSSHLPVNYEKLAEIEKSESIIGLNGLDVYRDFVDRIKSVEEELMTFLTQAKSEGKRVCGLGASTKGNVLLQYFEIDSNLVESVGEVNPDKFGCFTPGTLIPMIDEKEVLKSRPDYLLVLPWHFRNFFLNLPALKGMTLVFPLPKLELVHIPDGS